MLADLDRERCMSRVKMGRISRPQLDILFRGVIWRARLMDRSLDRSNGARVSLSLSLSLQISLSPNISLTICLSDKNLRTETTLPTTTYLSDRAKTQEPSLQIRSREKHHAGTLLPQSRSPSTRELGAHGRRPPESAAAAHHHTCAQHRAERRGMSVLS